MYLLSGIAGGISIVASLFLVYGLFQIYEIQSPQNGTMNYARLVLPGFIAVGSALASIWFHHQHKVDPNRRESPRLKLAEGILFTLVGGVLVVGGFLWLSFSGGFMGLHLIAFLLGGSLVVAGLCRLRAGP